MSYSSRPLSSHLRHQSGIGLNVGNGSTGSGGVGAGAGHVQSPALLARIQEKKVELESLQELRQLSESLARQMQVLQDKLSTLSSGTEGE